MKYSKSAIGLLTREYRSVLKKCLLINLGLFALGAVSVANAAEVTDVAGLNSALSAGGDTTVANDITGINTAITVSGKTNTLNLNGKTLSGDENTAAGYSFSGGSLTLNGGGTISGFYRPDTTPSGVDGKEYAILDARNGATIEMAGGDWTFSGNTLGVGALNSLNSSISADVNKIVFENNISNSQSAGLRHQDSDNTYTTTTIAANEIVFNGNKVQNVGDYGDAKYGGGTAVMNSGGTLQLLGAENKFTNNHMNAPIPDGKGYKRGGGAVLNQSHEMSNGTNIDSTMVIGKADGSSVNTFSGNSSSTNGGAVMNRAVDTDGNAYLTIKGNSTFSGNSATGLGGAIFNNQWDDHEAVVNIIGSALFENNTANGKANDIYNSGTLNLNASAITDAIILNGGITGNAGEENGGVGTVNILGLGYTKVANTLQNQNVSVASGATLQLDGADLTGTTIGGAGDVKVIGDSEMSGDNVINKDLEVEEGQELAITGTTENRASISGEGSLKNAEGGTLSIKNADVNVAIHNYGELYSDPTTYNNTVNNYAGAYASFDHDTFNAELANSGTVDLNTVTFNATMGKITGNGVTNLVSGTTAFNNTANSNTIKVASGAGFSGTIANTDAGVVDTRNGVIEASGVLGTVTGGKLYVDANLNNGSMDKVSGTINKINVSNTAYGDAASVELNGTFANDVEVEGFSYYTDIQKNANKITFSDKLVNQTGMEAYVAANSTKTTISPTTGQTNQYTISNGVTGEGAVSSTFYNTDAVDGLLAAKQNKLTADNAGANISIDENGKISATDTKYENATASAAGLMSAAHFSKLEGIEAGAQVNKIEKIKIGNDEATITDKTVALGSMAAANTADYETKAVAEGKYAAKATTLAGYGINDAYTKTEADNTFYNKDAVDNALGTKFDKASIIKNTYGESETAPESSDTTVYSAAKTDALLGKKQNTITTGAGLAFGTDADAVKLSVDLNTVAETETKVVMTADERTKLGKALTYDANITGAPEAGETPAETITAETKVYSVAATDAKIAASADTKANVALDNLSDAGQAVIDNRADSRIDTLVGHAAVEGDTPVEASGLFAKVDANTANITANRDMFEDKEGELGSKLTVTQSIAKALTPYETAETAEGKYFAKANIEVLTSAASGNDKVYSVAKADDLLSKKADAAVLDNYAKLTDVDQTITAKSYKTANWTASEGSTGNLLLQSEGNNAAILRKTGSFTLNGTDGKQIFDVAADGKITSNGDLVLGYKTENQATLTGAKIKGYDAVVDAVNSETSGLATKAAQTDLNALSEVVGHASVPATEEEAAKEATGLFANVEANAANIAANRNMFEDKEGVLGGKLTVAESIQARINNGNGTVDADTKVYSTDVTDNLISTAVTNATTEITNGVTEAWTKAYNWSKYILGVEPKDLKETQLQTALNKLGASEEEGGDGKGNNIAADNFAGALHELDVEKLAKSSAQEGATLELENADGYFTAIGEKGDGTSGYLSNQLTVNSNEAGIVLSAKDNRQGVGGKTSTLEVTADGVFYRNGTQSSDLDEVATLGTAKDGIYSSSGDTAVTIEEAIAANTALFENDEEEGTKLSVTQSIAKALSGKQDITAKDVAAQSLKVSVPATETAAENVIFEAKAGENGNTIALNGKTTVKGGLVTDSLNFGGKNTVDKITTKMINSENKGTNVLATAAAVYKAIGHVDGLVTADDQGVRTFNGTEAEGLVSTNLAGEEGAQHYYGNLATGTDVARDLVSLDNAVGNLNFKASDATGEGEIPTNYLNGVTTVSGALSKLDTQAKANADGIAGTNTRIDNLKAEDIAIDPIDVELDEFTYSTNLQEAIESAAYDLESILVTGDRAAKKAEQAEKDGEGNVISTTYAKQTALEAEISRATGVENGLREDINANAQDIEAIYGLFEDGEAGAKLSVTDSIDKALSSGEKDIVANSLSFGGKNTADKITAKAITNKNKGETTLTTAAAVYDTTTIAEDGVNIAKGDSILAAAGKLDTALGQAQEAIGTINDNITVAAPAEGEAYNYIEAGTDVADNLVALDKGIATAQKAAQDYAVAYTNAYAANAKYDADADYAEDSIGGAIQANTEAIDALEDATTITANGHYYTTEDTVASAVSKVDSNLARVENYVGKTTGYLNDQIAKTNKSLGEEIEARKAADTALQGNIDAEAERAKGVEDRIQGDLSQLNQNVVDGFNTINTEIGKTNTALNEEVARATAAEAALQSDIDKRKVTIENGIASITDGTTTAEVYTKEAAEAIFYEKQKWVDETLGITSAETDAVKNAYADTNYLKDATTLTGADKILDSTIKTVDDKFTNGTVDAKFASVTTTGDANIGGDLNVKGGISATNGLFTVHDNGYVDAAGGKFTVGQGGSISATNGKFEVYENGYVKAANGKFTVTEGGAMSAANDKFVVDKDGAMSAANDKFVVDKDGAMSAANDKFVVDKDGAMSAANDMFVVDKDGAMSAANDKFVVDKDGNVTAAGNLNVSGTSNLKDTNVDGKLTVTNGAEITGKTVVKGEFGAGATGTEFQVNTAGVAYAQGLNVNDAFQVGSTGNVYVGIDKFTVDAANGNVTTKGTVNINGATLTGSDEALTSDKKIVSANGFEVDENNSLTTDGLKASAADIAGNAKVGGDLEVKGGISATNGLFTVHDNGYVDAAGGKFKVGQGGSISATNGKFTVHDNGYIDAAGGKFTVGENGYMTASNGKFTVGENGYMTAAAGKFSVGENGSISASNGNFVADKDGNVTAAGDLSAAGGNFTVVTTTDETDPDNPKTTTNMTLVGNETINGNLGVTGTAWLTNAQVSQNLNVQGDAKVGALVIGEEFATSIDNGTTAVEGDGSSHALATTATVMTSAENAKYTNDGTGVVNAKGSATLHDAIQVLDNAMGTMVLNTENKNLVDDSGATLTNATDALNALDGVVGNVKDLDVSKGNLHATNKDVASHLSALDARLGTIKAIDGGEKGNLAAADSDVATHFGSLDTAIGNRTAYNNANNFTGYVAENDGSKDLTTMISEVASNIGKAGDITSTNQISAQQTVNANLSSLDAAIGNVADLQQLGYSNVTQAIIGTDAKFTKAIHDLDMDQRKLRHDFEGGMASQAALSALVPNGRAKGDTQLSIGTGAYKGHTAAAVGGFHWFTDNLLFNAGVAWDNNEATGRMGITYSW